MKLKFLFFAAVLLLLTFFACKKTETSATASATITAITCSGVSYTATPATGVAFSGTATVPYTGGNGVAFSAGTAITSTGVTGLTATLAAGTLANGAGNLTYTISGTPSAAGTAYFAISLGGQSCSMAVVVNGAGGGTVSIGTLSCGTAAYSSSATPGTAFTGTATVPYTGGNGVSYTAGSAIASTGVTGLTATLSAGTLANGAGNLTYTIMGTPSAAGTASFAISFGGQSCTLSLPVNAASGSCAAQTGVAKVVCLANAFLSTLSTTQQATVVLPLTLANAKRWSNLPCGVSCRNGLAFSSLTAVQLTAAKAVIQAAAGTTAGEGYDEFIAINTADNYLGTLAGSGYSSGNYIIAFLGAPSATGKWMLQYGGHHYAANITYDAGSVTSITPSHQGIEPTTFTYNGTTYSPMATEKSVMADMLAAFTTTELSAAKISGTFSDVTLVPGSTTNTFPATKVGIKVSTLSSAAQAKVLAAMAPWINDLDPSSAAAFTTLYTNELANTYVSYASNNSGTAGNAASFFTTNTDYVRIDGPSVWTEFICQTGVVVPSQIHYHSVYRDHTRDYIGL